MKKFLKLVIAFALLIPFSALAANIGAPWQATTTTPGNIFPVPINGNYFPIIVPYITASSTTATSSFSNGINLTGGCFSVGGICFTGGGGSGTVNSGTSGQIAWYGSTGTAVSGNSNLTYNTGNNTLNLSAGCYRIAGICGSIQNITGGDQLNDFASTNPVSGNILGIDGSQNQATMYYAVNQIGGAWRTIFNFPTNISLFGVDPRASSAGTGLTAHFFNLNDNQLGSTSASDATEVYTNWSHSAANSGSGGCYNVLTLVGGSPTTTPIDNNHNDACIVTVPSYGLLSNSASNFGTFSNPSLNLLDGFGQFTTNGSTLYNLDSWNYPIDYLDYGSSTSQFDIPYQIRDIGTPYQKAYIFTLTGITNIPSNNNADLYSPDGTSSGRLYQVSTYSNTISGGTGNMVFIGTSTPPASGVMTKIYSNAGSSDFTITYSAVALAPASMQYQSSLSVNEKLGITTIGTTTIQKGLTLGNVIGSTQCLHTNSLGQVSGTGSDCGSGSGGALYPFTTLTNFGVTTSATSTPLWAQAGIYASSTSALATTTGIFQDTGGAVYNVKAYGAKGDDSTDDTLAIQKAINAMPAIGGRLYFPTGAYKITNTLSIAHPMTIEGTGMSNLRATTTLSTNSQSSIVLASSTALAFDVHQAGQVTFRNLSIINVSGTTPTAGAGILVEPVDIWQKVDYDSIFVYGFWNNIDSQAGAYWTANNLLLAGPVNDGIKIQNLINHDSGDWSITNSTIAPYTQTANAAIEIQSSGGGKITNLKTNCDDLGCSKRFAYAILGGGASFGSSILLISNDSFESYTTNGVDLTDYPNVTISNSEFGQYGNSGGNAIHLNGTHDVTISNDLFTGDNTPAFAIALTNTTNTHITNNAYDNFVALYNGSGDTGTFVSDENATSGNRDFTQTGNVSFTTGQQLTNGTTIGWVPSASTFGNWENQTSWNGNAFAGLIYFQDRGGNVAVGTTSVNSAYKFVVSGDEFNAGSLTAGKITATSSLVLPYTSGTQCLHEVSGVVSGTGSDCGSGGGGSSVGPVNTLQASNGSGGFIATGTPQLTVGNLLATSTTATSTFAGDIVQGSGSSVFTVDYTGNVGVGTSTPFANLSIQSNLATGDAFVIATSTGKSIGGYDNDGHRFTAGPAPVISSCGTGTGTVVGDDQSGTITTATAATACTMTFAKAYRTAPMCNVTDDSLVGFADISSISTTATTFGISSALTGGHLYYSCAYHRN